MNTILSICVLCLLMYIKINMCEYHVYVFGGYRLMIYDMIISLFGIKTFAEALVEYVKLCLKYIITLNIIILGNKFRYILNTSRTMFLCN